MEDKSCSSLFFRILFLAGSYLCANRIWYVRSESFAAAGFAPPSSDDGHSSSKFAEHHFSKLTFFYFLLLLVDWMHDGIQQSYWEIQLFELVFVESGAESTLEIRFLLLLLCRNKT